MCWGRLLGGWFDGKTARLGNQIDYKKAEKEWCQQKFNEAFEGGPHQAVNDASACGELFMM